MMNYNEMIKDLMNTENLTFSEANENKYDYNCYQCENCKQWCTDPTDMATSGGVNGEDSICENCFENVENSLCDEVREIIKAG